MLDGMGQVPDHRSARDSQDRSETLALLAEMRPALGSGRQDEVFEKLAYLEDYRSIGPLTAIVEDCQLPERMRGQASRVAGGFDDTVTGVQCRRWWASGDRVLMAHALRLMRRPEADIVAAVAADDRHPLQAQALTAMAFGYDEPQFPPIVIRALGHRVAAVREAAAGVLRWDEPAAAEEPLIGAAFDPSAGVAVAAVDALQYYPSRRVLRVLADLRENADDTVQAQAAASFDFAQGCFQDLATYGEARHVKQLRAWMAPVADLIAWPQRTRPKRTGQPAARPARNAVPSATLLDLLANKDGEGRARDETLRRADWQAYGLAERRQLTEVLATHPDPDVRAIATAPLAEWSKTDELLTLTSDRSFLVRKLAMYSLQSVPRRPVIAQRAWEIATNAESTAAVEALQTYVVHAPAADRRKRLAALAQADPRQSIRAAATDCLASLGAADEIQSLLPVLREPPAVSWTVHIVLLDALRKLRLQPPQLRNLESVDNLYLVEAITKLQ